MYSVYKIFFVLGITLMVLTACYSSNETVTGNKDKVSPGTLTEPPILTISTGNQVIEAVQGTTSWSYSIGNGNYTGIEADSGPPPELVEYQEKVLTLESDREIELNFAEKPITYTVSI
ncbi:hypothetical protein ACOI1C_04135 [Bacillus sp. DJP31]|uniref:hypothetical protein n=1 Tax=Bacillus sp. DJP31 TaxID=3409789 RepID=UPI003BB4DEB1